MREEVYNFIERNEESHWWYRGRRLIFEEILGKILKGKSDGKIYEIGWSGADKLSLHKRRYTREQLNYLLRAAGFTPLRLTYFNTILFLPILVVRLLERILKSNPRIEYKLPPGFLNHLFFKIFAFERYLLKYFNLPFGVSLMAIAKKRR